MKEYWALDRGKWSTSRPGRFASEREPRYQLTRRLSGPQSRFGRFGKEKNHLQPTQWPRGLRCGFAATRLPGIAGSNPAGGMDICFL